MSYTSDTDQCESSSSAANTGLFPPSGINEESCSPLPGSTRHQSINTQPLENYYHSVTSDLLVSFQDKLADFTRNITSIDRTFACSRQRRTNSDPGSFLNTKSFGDVRAMADAFNFLKDMLLELLSIIRQCQSTLYSPMSTAGLTDGEYEKIYGQCLSETISYLWDFFDEFREKIRFFGNDCDFINDYEYDDDKAKMELINNEFLSADEVCKGPAKNVSEFDEQFRVDHYERVPRFEKLPSIAEEEFVGINIGVQNKNRNIPNDLDAREQIANASTAVESTANESTANVSTAIEATANESTAIESIVNESTAMKTPHPESANEVKNNRSAVSFKTFDGRSLNYDEFREILSISDEIVEEVLRHQFGDFHWPENQAVEPLANEWLLRFEQLSYNAEDEVVGTDNGVQNKNRNATNSVSTERVSDDTDAREQIANESVARSVQPQCPSAQTAKKVKNTRSSAGFRTFDGRSLNYEEFKKIISISDEIVEGVLREVFGDSPAEGDATIEMQEANDAINVSSSNELATSTDESVSATELPENVEAIVTEDHGNTSKLLSKMQRLDPPKASETTIVRSTTRNIRAHSLPEQNSCPFSGARRRCFSDYPRNKPSDQKFENMSITLYALKLVCNFLHSVIDGDSATNENPSTSGTAGASSTYLEHLDFSPSNLYSDDSGRFLVETNRGAANTPSSENSLIQFDAITFSRSLKTKIRDLLRKEDDSSQEGDEMDILRIFNLCGQDAITIYEKPGNVKDTAYGLSNDQSRSSNYFFERLSNERMISNKGQKLPLKDSFDSLNYMINPEIKMPGICRGNAQYNKHSDRILAHSTSCKSSNLSTLQKQSSGGSYGTSPPEIREIADGQLHIYTDTFGDERERNERRDDIQQVYASPAQSRRGRRLTPYYPAVDMTITGVDVERNDSETNFKVFEEKTNAFKIRNDNGSASSETDFVSSDSSLVNKVKNFQRELYAANYKRGPILVLKIRREDVLEESFRTLMNTSDYSPNDYRDIQVFFKDQNGVTEEKENSQMFFTILGSVLFSSDYEQLFSKPMNESSCLHLNPFSPAAPDMFFFAGVVLALSLLHTKTLGVKLPACFWKGLLCRVLAVTDLKEIDPILYQKLVWLYCNRLSDSNIQMTFSVREKCGEDIYITDLVPNGSSVLVTEANKYEFIQMATKWKILERCEQQLTNFRQGFTSVLEMSFLDEFTSKDLQYMTFQNSIALEDE